MFFIGIGGTWPSFCTCVVDRNVHFTNVFWGGGVQESLLPGAVRHLPSTGSIAPTRNDVRAELVVDIAGSGHLLVPTRFCDSVGSDALWKQASGRLP